MRGLVALLCLACVIANAAIARDASRWQIAETTLSNGMRVVTVPDTRAPVVTHLLWVNAGASDSPDLTPGVAHFLEHLMMFEATAHHPAGAFSQTIAGLGGMQNAFTDKDSTVFFQRIPPAALDVSMAFDADRLRHLRLSEAGIEKERRVILQERQQQVERATPLRMMEAHNTQVFGAHPYSRSTLGTPEDIRAIDMSELQAFYDRHYWPDNALLLVVGDVSAETVTKLARETYGTLPARPKGDAPLPAHGADILNTDATGTWSGPDVPASSVRYSWIVPGRSQAAAGEREALVLMSYLLGQGKDPKLARTLQAQGHAVRAASAEFGDTTQDYGLFTLFGMPARVEDTQDLSDGLFNALQRLADEGPTPDALEQAKAAQAMRSVFDRDEQMSLAISIGRALSAGQSAAEVTQEAARFEAVDAEMIRQSASRWLLRQPNMTAHLRPQH